jgi:hypothetical protein
MHLDDVLIERQIERHTFLFKHNVLHIYIGRVSCKKRTTFIPSYSRELMVNLVYLKEECVCDVLRRRWKREESRKSLLRRKSYGNSLFLVFVTASLILASLFVESSAVCHDSWVKEWESFSKTRQWKNFDIFFYFVVLCYEHAFVSNHSLDHRHHHHNSQTHGLSQGE